MLQSQLLWRPLSFSPQEGSMWTWQTEPKMASTSRVGHVSLL